MIAPLYIQRELAGVDSLYFAIFNPRIRDKKNMSYGKGRWQIRKWTGICPKRLDLWGCSGYSEVIMTICKEEMTHEGLVDAGYENIDRRVITAIRESNYWMADYKRKLDEIDWNNENLERKAKAEFEYESKWVAKNIWRKFKEPTVLLSGKEWKI